MEPIKGEFSLKTSATTTPGLLKVMSTAIACRNVRAHAKTIAWIRHCPCTAEAEEAIISRARRHRNDDRRLYAICYTEGECISRNVPGTIFGLGCCCHYLTHYVTISWFYCCKWEFRLDPSCVSLWSSRQLHLDTACCCNPSQYIIIPMLGLAMAAWQAVP